MSRQTERQTIQVCAHWQGMEEPLVMGELCAATVRGRQVFSFEYAPAWLRTPHLQLLDPDLALYSGPQYAPEGRNNFGIFLDSSPDRWGRVLMKRREVRRAKEENRDQRTLRESDYLLGVYDGHRMGALRFRLAADAPFLDDQTDMAAPPWTRLRDLEKASLQLEQDQAETHPDYRQWLSMLIAPGGSLGGARPKASVLDEREHPWVAKFPSRRDEVNVGRWEFLVHQLAQAAGIEVAEAKVRDFSGTQSTFLTRRFDRTAAGERIHFASAMTLLGKQDGDGADTGVSYLDLADFLTRKGGRVAEDLEQLWRRLVFYICVSNTDDHLRNHGFMLREQGWVLSPAYDINPSPDGGGLALNISEKDNEPSLDLALEVAPFFRIKDGRAEEIIGEVVRSLRTWRAEAGRLGLPAREISLMERAFRVADAA